MQNFAYLYKSRRFYKHIFIVFQCFQTQFFNSRSQKFDYHVDNLFTLLWVLFFIILLLNKNLMVLFYQNFHKKTLKFGKLSLEK